jgi:DHA1 family bicyclomycin/chloramphenicol resistance-like MFS transporter
MIGYVTSGMVVAPLVAPALGGLIDELFGWRANFLVCAALGGGALLLALARLPETRPSSIVGQGFGEVARRSLDVSGNRRFLGFAMGAAMTSGVFFCFLGAAPYLVIETMGLPKTTYGLWFICLAGGYMAGNFAAGRFSQKVGTDRMIGAGAIVSFAGAAAFLLAALALPLSPAALFLPALLTSLGNGLLLPNAVAAAVSVDPKAAGAASGVTGFLQMGLGAVASFIAGKITGETAVAPALLMLAMSVAAWLCVLDARRSGA